ncbi:MAG: hypothetical protein KGL39_60335, partial [Patescibacteria group bacterium]|nr:hypothetical protein [Patescibacteria group bacterium]
QNAEAGNRQIDNLSWELNHANRTISEQQSQITSLSEALTQVKKDRDDYGMQMMALEDQVTQWKGKAEAARAKLADMASLFKVDEPEPPKAAESEPVQLSEGQSTPVPDHDPPPSTGQGSPAEDKPWWSRDNDPPHVTETKPTPNDDEIPF